MADVHKGRQMIFLPARKTQRTALCHSKKSKIFRQSRKERISIFNTQSFFYTKIRNDNSPAVILIVSSLSQFFRSSLGVLESHFHLVSSQLFGQVWNLESKPHPKFPTNRRSICSPGRDLSIICLFYIIRSQEFLI